MFYLGFLAILFFCVVGFSMEIWEPPICGNSTNKNVRKVGDGDEDQNQYMQFLDLPKAMQGDTLKCFTSSCTEINLECSFLSESMPELFWWKSGNRLYNNSHFIIQSYCTGQNSYLLQLLIQNVTENDFGSYSCHCRNERGTAKSSVTLRELSPPACVPATLAPVRNAASKLSISFCIIMFLPLTHVWLNLSGN